jgi:hypothetical protein
MGKTYGIFDRWAELSTRTQLVLMIVLAGAIVGFLAIVMSAEGREPGSALAASACVAVVDGGREVANRSRSMQSYLALLADKEAEMRSAVALNERYRPLLAAIVGLRSALTSGGDVGPHAELLGSECG